MRLIGYEVQLGSERFETAGQDLLGLSVDTDMGVPSDECTLDLKPGQWSTRVSAGDSVIVSIGYDQSRARVFSGIVNMIQSFVDRVRVTCLGNIVLLTRLRVNQVYENQSSGAIVRDLSEKAGLTVKEGGEGLRFPVYVVDDAKDAFCHARELAARCGFDLYLVGDGRVVFKRYSPQRPRPFTYARDILHAEVTAPSVPDTSVRVYGESPSSFRGERTTHQKTKRVVEGSSGEGSPWVMLDDPVIRDKDSADQVAAAVMERILVPLRGTIRVVGTGMVGLGDTIEVRDMPDERMNGEFRVVGVHHRITKNEGFTTLVDWEKPVQITPRAPPPVEPSRPSPPRPPSPVEEELESARRDLEEQTLALVDVVEQGEADLSDLFSEIQRAISEMEAKADEMIAAAEEVKNAAMEAVREAREKAEELLRELEEKKGEILDSVNEAKAKYEEFKVKAMEKLEECTSKAEELKGEAQEFIREKTAKIEEFTQKAEEEAGKVREAISEGGAKLNDLRSDVESRISDLQAEKDRLTAEAAELSGEAGAEQRVQEIQSSVRDVENRMNEAGRELQEAEGRLREEAGKAEEKVNELKEEAEEKCKDIRDQLEEKKKEAEDKLKEFEEKGKEVQSEVERVEGQVMAKVEETERQIEQLTGEVSNQVGEYLKMAEDLEREAEEKFTQAKEKVEEFKRQIAEKMEDLQAAYREAREKVMEAKRTAGLE